jgi:hypothetical protein
MVRVFVFSADFGVVSNDSDLAADFKRNWTIRQRVRGSVARASICGSISAGNGLVGLSPRVPMGRGQMWCPLLLVLKA